MSEFPAIYKYATTNEGKNEAIKEFYEYIEKNGIESNNACIMFMREVDNSCPDYKLKADLRTRIVEGREIFTTIKKNVESKKSFWQKIFGK